MSAPRPKVLIVDDEPENCFVAAKALEPEGYEALAAYSGPEALERLESDPEVRLVLLDIRMPGMDGVEVLERIRARDRDLPVVIVSAFEHVHTAVKCMRLGAYDYLTKPLNLHELRVTVANGFQMLRLRGEVSRLQVEIDRHRGLDGFVGASAAAQRARELIQRVAPHDIGVLIVGEGGTGKELAAEAIHALSPRRDRPFIAVDCSLQPESLLEAEIFGEPGPAGRPGKAVEARGGTLYLHDAGSLPPTLQLRLARLLKERSLDRGDERGPVPVDVRVLASSPADLRAQARAGGFREDLLGRLDEFDLRLPPLRERGGDIELLARHFLERFNAQLGRRVGGFSPQALRMLQDHPWPGNVRELLNAVKRAVVLAETVIEPGHLPPELAEVRPQAAAPAGPPAVLGVSLKEASHAAARRAERELVVRALQESGNNKTQAARLLRVDYKTLQNKIREFGLA